MSDTITLSINELRALLRKAFEGVFGHSRDWNAMTDTVIWLECHNHNGMAIFFECYSNLKPDRQAHLSRLSANEWVIDPNGAPLIEYVHHLSDILLAAAKNTGRAEARVNTVENTMVLDSIGPQFRRAGFELSYTIDENSVLVTAKKGQSPDADDNTHYLEVLDNGYPMSRSAYIKLCEYADKVLVPATEQSRRGAGE